MMILKSTQPVTEMSTRNSSCGGQRRPVFRDDNLTTFICRLSGNFGASTSWNAQSLSMRVLGLFTFIFMVNYSFQLHFLCCYGHSMKNVLNY